MSSELLARVRERARANLFWRHLGIEVDEAGEGWVRLRVPVRDELRNATGAPVHGGVYSALVDTAVGGAGGAAVGAVAGAVSGGGAGRGAAIGAATGATVGAVHGAVKSSGPSSVYKNFVDRCLREKGYEVIGWQ